MRRWRLPVAVMALLTWTWRASTAPASASPPDGHVHIVRAGDTLWDIARQHRTTPDALARANDLANPNRLPIGARVAVRGKRAVLAPVAPRGLLGQPSMGWPSRGVVTSRFGFRGKRHHNGVDIAAPIGSPIAATRAGIVQFAGWQGAYGRLVILDHGANLTTWYGHASKILVRVGQGVATGEPIAQVGVSGRVTGPNVHFEVHRNNTPVDPWPFLTR